LRRTVGLLFLLLSTASCAHEGFPIWAIYKDSVYVYLTDKRFEPKPDDYEVQVLDALPSDHRYILLANVQIRKKAKDRFGKVTPEEVLEQLKELTRQIGGDAIYNIRYDPNPNGPYRITHLSGRATAIVLIKSHPLAGPQ
jgi:hypothetical protein